MPECSIVSFIVRYPIAIRASGFTVDGASPALELNHLLVEIPASDCPAVDEDSEPAI